MAALEYRVEALVNGDWIVAHYPHGAAWRKGYPAADRETAVKGIERLRKEWEAWPYNKKKMPTAYRIAVRMVTDWAVDDE